jgi:glycerophosphoryl diester phosphodiesterase
VLRLRGTQRPLAIGHRGAPSLAAENTAASFRAAVELGVDLVEFDVLQRNGSLVVAHSLHELPDPLQTLDEALDLLGGSGCGLHVDVKGVGFEREIVDALRRRGLEERALVSTTRPPSLRAFAELAPQLQRALSYPEDRYGVTRSPLLHPAIRGGLQLLRRVLPARIARMLAGAGASIASLEQSVVTRAVVQRCHAVGIPVIVWTVDDPQRVRGLAELGVDAIVSNDPGMLVATLSA